MEFMAAGTLEAAALHAVVGTGLTALQAMLIFG